MIKIISRKKIVTGYPDSPENKTGWPWDVEVSPKIYTGKNFPKISIVTPSLNQGEYIEQTIRSVLLQNYPNLEYIIIDGGSTDNTLEIIKKYSKWIKYYESKKDNGQSEAINKGLTKCTGDIFNWLNSDDYYEMDCFKNIADNYENEETEVLAGRYRFFYEGKNKEKFIDLKLRDTLEETIALVSINQPSSFFKLSIIKELGGINEKFHSVMDQDLWKKYLFGYGQSRIKIIKESLVNFRYHSNSKTAKNKFLDEYMNIFYSIALKSGMRQQAEVLKKIYKFKDDERFEFNIKFTKENNILGKKVINSLILFNAKEAYTSGDMNLLNNCLSVLENKWLNIDQRNFTRTLKIKSKLLKYNLKPVLKMIHRTNNMARFKFAKETSGK